LGSTGLRLDHLRNHSAIKQFASDSEGEEYDAEWDDHNRLTAEATRLGMIEKVKAGTRPVTEILKGTGPETQDDKFEKRKDLAKAWLGKIFLAKNLDGFDVDLESLANPVFVNDRNKGKPFAEDQISEYHQATGRGTVQG
jgi:hypothetical protein